LRKSSPGKVVVFLYVATGCPDGTNVMKTSAIITLLNGGEKRDIAE